MFLKCWRRRSFRESQAQRSSQRPHYRRNRFYPCLELLEARLAPAVFNVNTTADTVAANLNTGQDSMGNISLRSAIQAANHLGGTNSINLPAGTYKLTIADTANGTEANASEGDLDIQNNLTITGTAPAIIDGNQLDRVFQVFAGFTVTITSVTIQNGSTFNDPGGAVRNAGTLILSNDVITSSQAAGGAQGGGVWNSGILTL